MAFIWSDPYVSDTSTMITQSYTSKYWSIWISDQTAAISSVVWTRWNSQSLENSQTQLARQLPPPRIRTADEIASEERRIAEYRQRERELVRRQREACIRADTLLLFHLTKQQKEEYRKHGRFCVHTAGGRIYRLRAGSYVGNIDVMDPKGKEVVHRLCAHPTAVPMADTLLTQLMMLRHHEEDFVRIANRH